MDRDRDRYKRQDRREQERRSSYGQHRRQEDSDDRRREQEAERRWYQDHDRTRQYRDDGNEPRRYGREPDRYETHWHYRSRSYPENQEVDRRMQQTRPLQSSRSFLQMPRPSTSRPPIDSRMPPPAAYQDDRRIAHPRESGQQQSQSGRRVSQSHDSSRQRQDDSRIVQATVPSETSQQQSQGDDKHPAQAKSQPTARPSESSQQKSKAQPSASSQPPSQSGASSQPQSQSATPTSESHKKTGAIQKTAHPSAGSQSAPSQKKSESKFVQPQIRSGVKPSQPAAHPSASSQPRRSSTGMVTVPTVPTMASSQPQRQSLPSESSQKKSEISHKFVQPSASSQRRQSSEMVTVPTVPTIASTLPQRQSAPTESSQKESEVGHKFVQPSAISQPRRSSTGMVTAPTMASSQSQRQSAPSESSQKKSELSQKFVQPSASIQSRRPSSEKVAVPTVPTISSSQTQRQSATSESSQKKSELSHKFVQPSASSQPRRPSSEMVTVPTVPAIASSQAQRQSASSEISHKLVQPSASSQPRRPSTEKVIVPTVPAIATTQAQRQSAPSESSQKKSASDSRFVQPSAGSQPKRPSSGTVTVPTVPTIATTQAQRQSAPSESSQKKTAIDPRFVQPSSGSQPKRPSSGMVTVPRVPTVASSQPQRQGAPSESSQKKSAIDPRFVQPSAGSQPKRPSSGTVTVPTVPTIASSQGQRQSAPSESIQKKAAVDPRFVQSSTSSQQRRPSSEKITAPTIPTISSSQSQRQSAPGESSQKKSAVDPRFVQPSTVSRPQTQWGDRLSQPGPHPSESSQQKSEVSHKFVQPNASSWSRRPSSDRISVPTAPTIASSQLQSQSAPSEGSQRRSEIDHRFLQRSASFQFESQSQPDTRTSEISAQEMESRISQGIIPTQQERVTHSTERPSDTIRPQSPAGHRMAHPAGYSSWSGRPQSPGSHRAVSPLYAPRGNRPQSPGTSRPQSHPLSHSSGGSRPQSPGIQRSSHSPSRPQSPGRRRPQSPGNQWAAYPGGYPVGSLYLPAQGDYRMAHPAAYPGWGFPYYMPWGFQRYGAQQEPYGGYPYWPVGWYPGSYPNYSQPPPRRTSPQPRTAQSTPVSSSQPSGSLPPLPPTPPPPPPPPEDSPPLPPSGEPSTSGQPTEPAAPVASARVTLADPFDNSFFHLGVKDWVRCEEIGARDSERRRSPQGQPYYCQPSGSAARESHQSPRQQSPASNPSPPRPAAVEFPTIDPNQRQQSSILLKERALKNLYAEAQKAAKEKIGNRKQAAMYRFIKDVEASLSRLRRRAAIKASTAARMRVLDNRANTLQQPRQPTAASPRGVTPNRSSSVRAPPRSRGPSQSPSTGTPPNKPDPSRRIPSDHSSSDDSVVEGSSGPSRIRLSSSVNFQRPPREPVQSTSGRGSYGLGTCHCQHCLHDILRGQSRRITVNEEAKPPPPWRESEDGVVEILDDDDLAKGKGKGKGKKKQTGPPRKPEEDSSRGRPRAPPIEPIWESPLTIRDEVAMRERHGVDFEQDFSAPKPEPARTPATVPAADQRPGSEKPVDIITKMRRRQIQPMDLDSPEWKTYSWFKARMINILSPMRFSLSESNFIERMREAIDLVRLEHTEIDLSERLCELVHWAITFIARHYRRCMGSRVEQYHCYMEEFLSLFVHCHLDLFRNYGNLGLLEIRIYANRILKLVGRSLFGRMDSFFHFLFKMKLYPDEDYHMVLLTRFIFRFVFIDLRRERLRLKNTDLMRLYIAYAKFRSITSPAKLPTFEEWMGPELKIEGIDFRSLPLVAELERIPEDGMTPRRMITRYFDWLGGEMPELCQLESLYPTLISGLETEAAERRFHILESQMRQRTLPAPRVPNQPVDLPLNILYLHPLALSNLRPNRRCQMSPIEHRRAILLFYRSIWYHPNLMPTVLRAPGRKVDPPEPPPREPPQAQQSQPEMTTLSSTGALPRETPPEEQPLQLDTRPARPPVLTEYVWPAFPLEGQLSRPQLQQPAYLWHLPYEVILMDQPRRIAGFIWRPVFQGEHPEQQPGAQRALEYPGQQSQAQMPQLQIEAAPPELQEIIIRLIGEIQDANVVDMAAPVFVQPSAEMVEEHPILGRSSVIRILYVPEDDFLAPQPELIEIDDDTPMPPPPPPAQEDQLPDISLEGAETYTRLMDTLHSWLEQIRDTQNFRQQAKPVNSYMYTFLPSDLVSSLPRPAPSTVGVPPQGQTEIPVLPEGRRRPAPPRSSVTQSQATGTPAATPGEERPPVPVATTEDTPMEQAADVPMSETERMTERDPKDASDRREELTGHLNVAPPIQEAIIISEGTLPVQTTLPQTDRPEATVPKSISPPPSIVEGAPASPRREELTLVPDVVPPIQEAIVSESVFPGETYPSGTVPKDASPEPEVTAPGSVGTTPDIVQEMVPKDTSLKREDTAPGLDVVSCIQEAIIPESTCSIETTPPGTVEEEHEQEMVPDEASPRPKELTEVSDVVSLRQQETVAVEATVPVTVEEEMVPEVSDIIAPIQQIIIPEGTSPIVTTPPSTVEGEREAIQQATIPEKATTPDTVEVEEASPKPEEFIRESDVASSLQQVTIPVETTLRRNESARPSLMVSISREAITPKITSLIKTTRRTVVQQHELEMVPEEASPEGEETAQDLDVAPSIQEATIPEGTTSPHEEYIQVTIPETIQSVRGSLSTVEEEHEVETLPEGHEEKTQDSDVQEASIPKITTPPDTVEEEHEEITLPTSELDESAQVLLPEKSSLVKTTPPGTIDKEDASPEHEGTDVVSPEQQATIAESTSPVETTPPGTVEEEMVLIGASPRHQETTIGLEVVAPIQEATIPESTVEEVKTPEEGSLRPEELAGRSLVVLLKQEKLIPMETTSSSSDGDEHNVEMISAEASPISEELIGVSDVASPGQQATIPESTSAVKIIPPGTVEEEMVPKDTSPRHQETDVASPGQQATMPESTSLVETTPLGTVEEEMVPKHASPIHQETDVASPGQQATMPESTSLVATTPPGNVEEEMVPKDASAIHQDTDVASPGQQATIPESTSPVEISPAGTVEVEMVPKDTSPRHQESVVASPGQQAAMPESISLVETTPPGTVEEEMVPKDTSPRHQETDVASPEQQATIPESISQTETARGLDVVASIKEATIPESTSPSESTSSSTIEEEKIPEEVSLRCEELPGPALVVLLKQEKLIPMETTSSSSDGDENNVEMISAEASPTSEELIGVSDVVSPGQQATIPESTSPIETIPPGTVEEEMVPKDASPVHQETNVASPGQQATMPESTSLVETIPPGAVEKEMVPRDAPTIHQDTDVASPGQQATIPESTSQTETARGLDVVASVQEATILESTSPSDSTSSSTVEEEKIPEVSSRRELPGPALVVLLKQEKLIPKGVSPTETTPSSSEGDEHNVEMISADASPTSEDLIEVSDVASPGQQATIPESTSPVETIPPGTVEEEMVSEDAPLVEQMIISEGTSPVETTPLGTAEEDASPRREEADVASPGQQATIPEGISPVETTPLGTAEEDASPRREEADVASPGQQATIPESTSPVETTPPGTVEEEMVPNDAPPIHQERVVSPGQQATIPESTSPVETTGPGTAEEVPEEASPRRVSEVAPPTEQMTPPRTVEEEMVPEGASPTAEETPPTEVGPQGVADRQSSDEDISAPISDDVSLRRMGVEYVGTSHESSPRHGILTAQSSEDDGAARSLPTSSNVTPRRGRAVVSADDGSSSASIDDVPPIRQDVERRRTLSDPPREGQLLADYLTQVASSENERPGEIRGLKFLEDAASSLAEDLANPKPVEPEPVRAHSAPITAMELFRPLSTHDVRNGTQLYRQVLSRTVTDFDPAMPLEQQYGISPTGSQRDSTPEDLKGVVPLQLDIDLPSDELIKALNIQEGGITPRTFSRYCSPDLDIGDNNAVQPVAGLATQEIGADLVQPEVLAENVVPVGAVELRGTNARPHEHPRSEKQQEVKKAFGTSTASRQTIRKVNGSKRGARLITGTGDAQTREPAAGKSKKDGRKRSQASFDPYYLLSKKARKSLQSKGGKKRASHRRTQPIPAIPGPSGVAQRTVVGGETRPATITPIAEPSVATEENQQITATEVEEKTPEPGDQFKPDRKGKRLLRGRRFRKGIQRFQNGTPQAAESLDAALSQTEVTGGETRPATVTTIAEPSVATEENQQITAPELTTRVEEETPESGDQFKPDGKGKQPVRGRRFRKGTQRFQNEEVPRPSQEATPQAAQAQAQTKVSGGETVIAEPSVATEENQQITEVEEETPEPVDQCKPDRKGKRLLKGKRFRKGIQRFQNGTPQAAVPSAESLNAASSGVQISTVKPGKKRKQKWKPQNDESRSYSSQFRQLKRGKVGEIPPEQPVPRVPPLKIIKPKGECKWPSISSEPVSIPSGSSDHNEAIYAEESRVSPTPSKRKTRKSLSRRRSGGRASRKTTAEIEETPEVLQIVPPEEPEHRQEHSPVAQDRRQSSFPDHNEAQMTEPEPEILRQSRARRSSRRDVPQKAASAHAAGNFAKIFAEEARVSPTPLKMLSKSLSPRRSCAKVYRRPSRETFRVPQQSSSFSHNEAQMTEPEEPRVCRSSGRDVAQKAASSKAAETIQGILLEESRVSPIPLKKHSLTSISPRRSSGRASGRPSAETEETPEVPQIEHPEVAQHTPIRRVSFEHPPAAQERRQSGFSENNETQMIALGDSPRVSSDESDSSLPRPEFTTRRFVDRDVPQKTPSCYASNLVKKIISEESHYPSDPKKKHRGRSSRSRDAGIRRRSEEAEIPQQPGIQPEAAPGGTPEMITQVALPGGGEARMLETEPQPAMEEPSVSPVLPMETEAAPVPQEVEEQTDDDVQMAEPEPEETKERHDMIEEVAEVQVAQHEEPRGSVTVEEARGGVTVEEARGSITVEEARGSVTVEEARGSVTVQKPSGSVTVEQPRGSVTVEEPRGTVTVQEPSSRSVTVEQPRRSVTVEEPRGSVPVEEPRGSVTVEKPSRSVTVEQPRGSVTVEEPCGSITREGARGTVTVEEPSGSVTVEQPRGTVTVEEPRGSVTVEKRSETVIVEEPRGTVTVEEPRGSVTMEEPRGSVTVEEPRGTVTVEEPRETLTVEQPRGTVTVEEPHETVTVEEPREVPEISQHTKTPRRTSTDESQKVASSEKIISKGSPEKRHKKKAARRGYKAAERASSGVKDGGSSSSTGPAPSRPSEQEKSDSKDGDVSTETDQSQTSQDSRRKFRKRGHIKTTLTTEEEFKSPLHKSSRSVEYRSDSDGPQATDTSGSGLALRTEMSTETDEILTLDVARTSERRTYGKPHAKKRDESQLPDQKKKLTPSAEGGASREGASRELQVNLARSPMAQPTSPLDRGPLSFDEAAIPAAEHEAELSTSTSDVPTGTESEYDRGGEDDDDNAPESRRARKHRTKRPRSGNGEGSARGSKSRLKSRPKKSDYSPPEPEGNNYPTDDAQLSECPRSGTEEMSSSDHVDEEMALNVEIHVTREEIENIVEARIDEWHANGAPPHEEDWWPKRSCEGVLPSATLPDDDDFNVSSESDDIKSPAFELIDRIGVQRDFAPHIAVQQQIALSDTSVSTTESSEESSSITTSDTTSTTSSTITDTSGDICIPLAETAVDQSVPNTVQQIVTISEEASVPDYSARDLYVGLRRELSSGGSGQRVTNDAVLEPHLPVPGLLTPAEQFTQGPKYPVMILPSQLAEQVILPPPQNYVPQTAATVNPALFEPPKLQLRQKPSQPPKIKSALRTAQVRTLEPPPRVKTLEHPRQEMPRAKQARIATNFHVTAEDELAANAMMADNVARQEALNKPNGMITVKSDAQLLRGKPKVTSILKDPTPHGEFEFLKNENLANYILPPGLDSKWRHVYIEIKKHDILPQDFVRQKMEDIHKRKELYEAQKRAVRRAQMMKLRQQDDRTQPDGGMFFYLFDVPFLPHGKSSSNLATKDRFKADKPRERSFRTEHRPNEQRKRNDLPYAVAPKRVKISDIAEVIGDEPKKRKIELPEIPKIPSHDAVKLTSRKPKPQRTKLTNGHVETILTDDTFLPTKKPKLEETRLTNGNGENDYPGTAGVTRSGRVSKRAGGKDYDDVTKSQVNPRRKRRLVND